LLIPYAGRAAGESAHGHAPSLLDLARAQSAASPIHRSA
jgi:hypothetical protein